MAAKPGKQGHDIKDDLIVQLAASRERLAMDLGQVASELDFAAKFRANVRRNTGTWLSGAAALGLVLALAPGRRRRKSKSAAPSEPSESRPRPKSPALKSAGLAMDILKFALPVLKPVLLAVVARQAQSMAGRIGTDPDAATPSL